ncbi:MAG: HEAT repeat domain-containing protein [Gemmatimonadetes bacterium]|nr:HEAT repeat domain-containing protein [Gemmatimonadota bacterium]
MVGLFVKNQKIGSRLALGALLAGASLGLACGGPTPEEYIQQFKSRQKAERVKAANQLIRFDADEVVPLLTEEADSGYIRVRFEVIQLLGRFKDERAVPTLIAALRDKSPRVAAAAAWALGEIGSPAALAPLLKYARDPTVEVRQYVLGALGSCHSYEAEPALSDSAFRVVRRALRAPKPKWRVAALQSLRAYGYRDAVEEVIRMSVDPSNEVRYVAVQALGQIGSAALRRPGPARNAIYEALLVALDADELQSIRSKAMHALAEMGDKRAEPHLQQLMREGTEEDQTAARLALYKLSPEVAEAMRQTELGAR